MTTNRHIIVATIVSIVLVFTGIPGNGKGIDSLTTKDDVQAYLTDNINRSTASFLGRQSDLSLDQLIKQMYNRAFSTVDTYDVVDPVNGKHMLRTVQRDSGDLHPGIFRNNGWANRSPGDIVNVLAKVPYRFYKCDIDGNGQTDLVINAVTTIIIMNLKDSLEYYIFSDPDFPALFTFNSILKMPDGWAISFNYKTCTEPPVVRTDTVVYKYGTFIKHNHSSNYPKVTRIGYQYVRNYGMIGDHTSNMQISSDGKCYLNYGYDGTGATFYGTVESNSLKTLFALATCIDWQAKDDEYYTPVDHDEGCSFDINFEDGTVKRVHYWGYLPTESELYLSSRLASISYIVSWQPTEPRRLIDVRDTKAAKSTVYYNDNCFSGW